MRIFQGRAVELMLAAAGAMLIVMAAGQAMGWDYVNFVGTALGVALLCMSALCFVARMPEFTDRDALQRMRGAADLWWCARGLEDDARLAQVADAYAIVDHLLPTASAEEIVRLASDSEFKFLRSYSQERALRRGWLHRKDPFFWLYNAVFGRLGLPSVEQGEEEQGLHYEVIYV